MNSPRRRLALAAGIAGLLGAAACSVSMVLAVIAGAAASSAAAAASMSSMSGVAGITLNQPPAIAFLIQKGPPILVASIMAMTLSVTLKRPWAALPVLVAGAILYWGMYLQAAITVMYVAIGLGLVTWAAVVGGTNLRGGRERAPSPATPDG